MYRQNCCCGVYAYEISRHASPGTYREERRSNLICGNSIVKRREQRAANRQADIVFYNVLSRPGIKILRAPCDTDFFTSTLTFLLESNLVHDSLNFDQWHHISSFFLSILFLGTSRSSVNVRKKKRKDRIPSYQEVRCHAIFQKIVSRNS